MVWVTLTKNCQFKLNGESKLQRKKFLLSHLSWITGNKLGNSLGQVSLNLEYFLIQPNFFNPTQLIVTLKTNPTQFIGVELNHQVWIIFQFH